MVSFFMYFVGAVFISSLLIFSVLKYGKEKNKNNTRTKIISNGGYISVDREEAIRANWETIQNMLPTGSPDPGKQDTVKKPDLTYDKSSENKEFLQNITGFPVDLQSPDFVLDSLKYSSTPVYYDGSGLYKVLENEKKAKKSIKNKKTKKKSKKKTKKKSK